ncbi:carboxylesterase [Alicyclobacillus sp. SO9]|uniref:alpha/beta hydrolase n=1 Tax=Alicyclobacillus sp. SO9 TaxID=2665646 RepID=UPI0018E7C2BE|nr:alpha/beta fold hydrolase [Alicyclobacillus sp. SO9]QQE78866.1 alpha/beta fold hydrolase [Alicyclobacillus sp. SO9]
MRQANLVREEYCVLLHGFTGDPTELAPLTEALRELEYHVSVPHLAGHDGTYSGLSGVSADQWIDSAEKPVIEALERGPVHLIGFSMGALIAAILASKQPIASLTMLSPALNYASPELLLRQAKVFLKGHFQSSSEESEYLRKRPSGFLVTPPSSVVQFGSVVRRAKQVLYKVTVPVCIIQGDMDEVIHPKSSQYVYNSVQSPHREIHQLPRSRHHVCLDVESDTVISKVTAFLSHCC